MQIAIADIQQIFSKHNALCFDSKLPIPKIKLGNAKNYLGQLRFKRKKKTHGKWLYCDFCICINTRYEIDRQKLEDVVIHEMIHYYIHYNGIADTSSHGVVFRKMMEDINTRFGRNITIADRGIKPTGKMPSQTRQTLPRPFLICVATLTNGETGVTVCARTRAFQIYDNLPLKYDISEFKWYITTDQFYRRFPRSTTAKLYRIKSEVLHQHLTSDTEMVRVGNVIKPKQHQ